VNDLWGSMSVAMNLLRPSNQLGDYLFPSDMERFNLDNFNNSLEWSNQAVSKEQKLQNDLDVISRNTMAFHYLGDDLKYRPSSTHPTQNEEVMNENYAKAFHPASRRTGNNATSNKNLHKPGKKVRNSKKSSLFNENRSSHEEEKIKIPDNFSSEQEHQNQMNMIFNNPEYFNQVAHQLQENHQEQQQHPYPSMYIIPLEMESQMIPEPSIESYQQNLHHQVDNSTPVTILSDSSYSVEIKNELKSLIDIDNSSDYYSDSASSSLSSSSSSSPCMSSASSSCGGDLDDDESMDMSSSFEVEYHFKKLISNENERTSLMKSNFISHEDNQDIPLELDEELNNLVLSIITE